VDKIGGFRFLLLKIFVDSERPPSNRTFLSFFEFIDQHCFAFDHQCSMTMTAKILVYIALLLTAVSAQTSDAPSDVPSMSPAGVGLSPTLMPVSIVDTEATALPTATKASACELCGMGREVSLEDKKIIFEGQFSQSKSGIRVSRIFLTNLHFLGSSDSFSHKRCLLVCLSKPKAALAKSWRLLL
jgi:hypothetical protein